MFDSLPSDNDRVWAKHAEFALSLMFLCDLLRCGGHCCVSVLINLKT